MAAMPRLAREGAVQVAVVGSGTCGERLRRLAHATGEALARAGATVVTGGLGGVMAAASEGARAGGGLTVGILPGADRVSTSPDPAVSIAIFTGMGQARNQLVVLSAGAVVAIGGGWGTLSEIGLALKQGRLVVLLESWSLERPDGADEPLLLRARTPEEAAALAVEAAAGRRAGPSAG